jgi:hypothetical protein
MKRTGEIYISYLESLVLALLAERESNGKGKFDCIEGIDRHNNKVSYSPYNVYEAIREAKSNQ